MPEISCRGKAERYDRRAARDLVRRRRGRWDRRVESRTEWREREKSFEGQSEQLEIHLHREAAWDDELPALATLPDLATAPDVRARNPHLLVPDETKDRHAAAEDALHILELDRRFAREHWWGPHVCRCL